MQEQDLSGTVAVELVDLAEVRDGRAVVTYSRTEAAIAVLREKYQGAKYDLTTTAGDKAARAGRLELKTLRTDLESKRKELKAPALEFGKRIDSEAARLNAEILTLEQPIDAQIKADEARREEERKAKEAAEAARKKVHTDAIARLAGYVAQAAELAAARIAAGIAFLEGIDLSGFEEFTSEATETRDRSLAALRMLHAKATAREAEEARLKEEREEQARVAAQQAEQARQLREQQEALDRQRAELEAREAEERRQRAAAEAEVHARARAEKEALEAEERREQAALAETLRREVPVHQSAAAYQPLTATQTTAGPAVIPMPTRAPAAPASPPSLRLGDIKKHLAPLDITAEGLRQIGFEPAGRQGSAVMYRDDELPYILTAAIQHLTKARDQLTAKAAA